MTVQRFVFLFFFVGCIGTATGTRAQPPSAAATARLPMAAAAEAPPVKGPTRAALKASETARDVTPVRGALEGALIGALVVTPVAAVASLFWNLDFDCEEDCGFNAVPLLVVEGVGALLGALVGYRLASHSADEVKPGVAPQVSTTADGKGATVGFSGRF